MDVSIDCDSSGSLKYSEAAVFFFLLSAVRGDEGRSAEMAGVSLPGNQFGCVVRLQPKRRVAWVDTRLF